jgi:NAD(P)H-nitrite reductase large subunit
MDMEKQKSSQGIVCTCNDLYREEIVDSIKAGWEEAKDVMFDHRTHFRCGQCAPLIEAIIKQETEG